MSAAARPATRHEWYQTDSTLVVSIFIKNVAKDSLSVQFEPSSFTISFPLPTGSQFEWGVDPLSRQIDTAKSTFRVLQPKIELTLWKKEEGVRWSKLEGEDEADRPAEAMSVPSTSDVPTHSYPSSSRRPATNWDKLAASALAEEESTKAAAAKDPNAGGDKQLNELFQKLYADATEDQRKAMIKSYQESNGTSLKEPSADSQPFYSQGKVKTHPPDSMVAKQWGA
ncbi:suppressor of G2 allele of SKP1, partial [Phenoliferia sp. Uapishka_3]